MTQKEFKVGDKVFDIRYGWGKVIREVQEIHFPSYELTVKFCDSVNEYFKDGRNTRNQKIPLLSHHEYTLQSVERVVLVSDDSENWVRRVLILEKKDGFVCWVNAETIEEADDVRGTYLWNYMKELTPKEIVELTIQDISEGKGKGVPAHLIRIKK